MTVRCWATATEENGFDVVNLNMVSPDDAPAYTLGEDNPFSSSPTQDRMARTTSRSDGISS